MEACAVDWTDNPILLLVGGAIVLTSLRFLWLRFWEGFKVWFKRELDDTDPKSPSASSDGKTS